MELLNLTLGQLLAIFLPLGAGLVALYFYDRSRRRLRVSTLRFWPRRPAPPVTRRHKKLQQPLSLLLQLLAMLLLLLAIADARFGFLDQPRRHVIILDRSAVMAARSGDQTLIEKARERALAYLRSLPAGDEAMLIRADSLAGVAVAFTKDRARIAEAIRATEPGWTALDLKAAIELARSSLELELGEEEQGRPLAEREGVGEVAYVGPARLRRGSAPRAGTAPYLRLIELDEEIDDAGIGEFRARRTVSDPTRWEVSLLVENHSPQKKRIEAGFFFDGRELGRRWVEAEAGGNARIDFRLRTERPGAIEAVLDAEDGLNSNRRAKLDLPGAVVQHIDVFSSRRERLRPLLTSTPQLEARFPSGAPETPSSLRLIDRGAAARPAASTIWFDPTPESSPAPITRVVRGARVLRWALDHPLGRGLRDADIVLQRASIFEPAPGDIIIASTAEGPVALARSGGGRDAVIFGFDPLEPGVANRLAVPLLFANAVEWFSPGVFRLTEVRAASPGAVEVETAGATPEEIEVVAENGPAPAWVLSEGRIRFYAGAAGTYRVRTPLEEVTLTLTLPEIGGERWEPPPGTLRGVPAPAAGGSLAGVELWPWLALAAAAIFVFDWMRFGRGLSAAPPAANASTRIGPLEATPLAPNRVEKKEPAA